MMISAMRFLLKPRGVPVETKAAKQYPYQVLNRHISSTCPVKSTMGKALKERVGLANQCTPSLRMPVAPVLYVVHIR
jgi:hypothetical protein